MINRYLVAVVAILLGGAAMAADVIKTTTGETITGRVIRFKRNPALASAGSFIIDVEGEKRSIALNTVDEITFEQAAASVTNPPAAQMSAARSDATAERPTSYWMSSTGKRHNSSCRYYGSGKGRSCGEKDGSPCKICGG